MMPHAFSAKVGECDAMVVADKYFAKQLKMTEDEYKEDLTESTELSFEVYYIRDRSDYNLLSQLIDSIT